MILNNQFDFKNFLNNIMNAVSRMKTHF